MATSPFVLAADGVKWKGTVDKNKPVTISVASADNKTTPQLEYAYYPKGTSLPIVNNTVTFPLVAGSANLSIFIEHEVPPIVWNVVEIGSDNSKQILATVNSPVPQEFDANSTAVRIKGA
jgi:hypothetical protein